MTHASPLHFLVDWLISLAVTLVLKKRVNGRISAVLSPIWLKSWPKVGLASPLDCYSMKKSGCLLKKRSFRRFPSLVGTPFSSNASRSVGRILAVLSPLWLKFWVLVALTQAVICYSMHQSARSSPRGKKALGDSVNAIWIFLAHFGLGKTPAWLK